MVHLGCGYVAYKRPGSDTPEVPWTYARTGEGVKEAVDRLLLSVGLVVKGDIRPASVKDGFRGGRARDITLTYEVDAEEPTGELPEGFAVIADGLLPR